MSGFYDLNIVVERENKDHMKMLIEVLRRAYMLGYDTVAVNTIFEAESLTNKGKNKGKEASDKIPPPLKISTADVIDKESRHRKFSILQRLTIVIKDISHTHHIQTSKIVQSYDILAVQPESDQALRTCCGTIEADIITFDMDVRSNVRPIPKQINRAIERGLFIELSYASGFISNVARRNTIFNGRRVIASFNKKNLIMSSKARLVTDIRGPYDVINLCYLFEINSAQAFDAVSKSPRRVVLKAECRKSAKGVFVVTPLSMLPEKDRWKLSGCTKIEIVQKETEVENPPPEKRRKKQK